jgi:hypothetical protein
VRDRLVKNGNPKMSIQVIGFDEDAQPGDGQR